jgi:hypothetical protein
MPRVLKARDGVSMSPPRRPQICPICGEPGDGVTWCAKCANDFSDRRSMGESVDKMAEWAAKLGRNFERLRNHKKAMGT